MIREPEHGRPVDSVPATGSLLATLGSLDHISGATGLFLYKGTVASADSGKIKVSIKVGNRVQVDGVVIPVEEAAGLGPTSRVKGFPIKGYRGDSIRVTLTNSSAGAVSVTSEFTLVNEGR